MPPLCEFRGMRSIPKKIDEELKARAPRLVQDHQDKNSSLTPAAAVVAKKVGVGRESGCR